VCFSPWLKAKIRMSWGETVNFWRVYAILQVEVESRNQRNAGRGRRSLRGQSPQFQYGEMVEDRFYLKRSQM
jgi:hypothetical protein